ncbi:phosphoglycerate dehydrogenase [Zavarzinella formosa]|uniref:phosphoglycerate dehydrogenase n=1 Tax=Zavarzinella formosa TaxID=360055 RepID=UPI000366D570|nr:phosphoglycerate dehydrogenase [Zavarzinella formosa]
MPRVLICDPLEAAGLEILTKAGIELDNRPGLKGEALQEAIRGCDGAVLRSGTRLTSKELEKPGKLRAVVRAGVGVDNIDVVTATRTGVIVMNTPSGNTVSAAEHTIALLLSVSRHIPAADASMKAGKWDRKSFLGTQVAGKTLGVIGLGRIGREVARRAVGLDMKVIGYDPLMTPEKAAEFGIKAFASKDELLPKCDYLTLHIPFTAETKDFISARELAMMPKGARVMNVARGGVVNEKALAEALHSKHIAGAGLDVFEEEPTPVDNPLLKAPNVVLTPHLGASTVEAQEAVAVEAAHLLVDFLTKGVIQCAVNMAAVNRAEMDEMRSFVDLARRLGLFQAQTAHGSIRKATLQFRGDLAKRNTKLLAAAFTAGLLERHLINSVNIVNAPVLARERGIEVVTSTSEHRGDFANLLHTEVETEQGKFVAGGTLFGDRYLRLVQLGEYRLDSYLDGILMVFPHQDVPGLIGFLGTEFGRHGVNIASMNLGRLKPGGEAVAVLNLDSQPSEEALKQVSTHPKIKSVQVVKLPPSGEMPVWFG